MSRRAFTLFELAIVLCIAGLLCALAVPRFAAARDRGATRAALGELGAAFSLARRTALLERSPVAIVLDTVSGSLEVRDARQTILYRSLSSAYGVSVRTTRDSAVYDPRGLGFGLSNMTVTVRRGRVVDTLTVSRLGRVRW